jgi:putative ABC transport system permease protein
MSLALSTLLYEWRRYMAAVIALAFAGLLVLAIIGLFMGISASYTANIARSPAPIMVLAPKATSLFGGGSGVPRRVIPQVYQHPEVTQVQDMAGNFAFWQNDLNAGGKSGGASGDKRQSVGVQVFVVDTAPGSPTLPTDFTEDIRQGLEEPYVVAVDDSALGRLGVKKGDRASLGGKSVKVKVVLHGYANINNPMVYTSRQTAKLVGLVTEGPRVGPLMVKLRDPARATIVRDELNARAGGLYRAWTREELAEANNGELLKEPIIGVMLLFIIAVGGFVGTVITWQTLRGAILANIKEFASLRALGVSMGSLNLIIMELSFWVGVAGLVLTGVLTWGVTALASGASVPLIYPLWSIIFIAVTLEIIAVVSGLLSLGILKHSQPADLLR